LTRWASARAPSAPIPCPPAPHGPRAAQRSAPARARQASPEPVPGRRSAGRAGAHGPGSLASCSRSSKRCLISKSCLRTQRFARKTKPYRRFKIVLKRIGGGTAWSSAAPLRASRQAITSCSSIAWAPEACGAREPGARAAVERGARVPEARQRAAPRTSAPRPPCGRSARTRAEAGPLATATPAVRMRATCAAGGARGAGAGAGAGAGVAWIASLSWSKAWSRSL